MSHDIRTPLNAIIGLTHLAHLHTGEEDRLKDYLEKISSAGTHLLSLINEVLDVSKIESGTMKLEETEFNLNQLLEDVVGMVRISLDQRRQSLSVHIEEGLHPQVIGDERRLKQILVNILDNASKYTPDHGCTGSDTVIPPIPGLSEVSYWTSKEALEIKELPETLVVIGGGVIGMEFASFFNSMGVKVHAPEAPRERPRQGQSEARQRPTYLSYLHRRFCQICPYLTSFHPILQDGGGFLLPSSVFSATIRQTGCFCNRREAAMEAYLGALRRVALFHGMEDRELLSMLDCLGARLRQYSKGDVIFHAGDPATHLGAVLTGQVQVSRTKADGQRVVMGEIRPGGLFAESFACARAESLPVTVTAAADAAVLLIDCGRISAPCSAACTFHTRLISNLLQVLAEKNLSLAGKLGHLSGRTIRERLLSYLEEQAARTGRATVTVPFDRQALADYLCVDRSALSRTIGALQREGVLTVRRDRFTLNF